MQALSLGLRAPYRLKRWVTLLAQASLRLDFTKGAPLDNRVTFTRASGGTSFRPVGYGPNLVVNGTGDSATGWTGATGLWTSTVGSVGGVLRIYAAGTTGGWSGALSTITGLTVGKTYTIACDFVAQAGWTSFSQAAVSVLAGGSAVVSLAPRATGGALVPATFIATNTTLDVRLRVEGTPNGAASTADFDNITVQEVFLDRPGDPIQLFTAPANVPRFDFDPATGACKGLLIEEQRTNLATQNRPSLVGGISVNGGSYSGTVTIAGITLDVIKEDVSTGVHRIEWIPSSGIAANTQYRWSCYVATAGRTKFSVQPVGLGLSISAAVTFTLIGEGSASIGVDIERVAEGLYRVSASSTTGHLRPLWVCDLTSSMTAETAATKAMACPAWPSAGRNLRPEHLLRASSPPAAQPPPGPPTWRVSTRSALGTTKWRGHFLLILMLEAPAQIDGLPR